MSTAVRQVVLKLHSRCNLACDHCYVYESADQTWQRQPVTMSRRTVGQVAARIGEHASSHGLSRLTVTLHGGEPLMAGADMIDYAVQTIAGAVPSGTRVDFTIQTNGLLLTDRMLERLAALGVRIGVSLDGGPAAHDRHRRYRHGGGSYTRVSEALDRLRADRFRHVFGGLLCTVDIENDPVLVYRSLMVFAPPRLDFLMPHGNWTTPPPGKGQAEGTPYADWLIQIFDLWCSEPPVTDIRIFSSIMALLVGGRSRTEAVGLHRAPVLVIETDGSIEQVDSLKSTTHGMAATGFTIEEHSFDDAVAHPAIEAQHRGLAGLAPDCQSCEIVSVCGGGLYAHRYREGAGFGNPTVYCADQFALIQHISRRLRADLAVLTDAQQGTG